MNLLCTFGIAVCYQIPIRQIHFIHLCFRTLDIGSENWATQKETEPWAVDHQICLCWPEPSVVYDYSDHSTRLCIAISRDSPGHKLGLLTGFMSLSGSLRTWEHITLSNYSGMNQVCVTPETSATHKATGIIFTFEICLPGYPLNPSISIYCCEWWSCLSDLPTCIAVLTVQVRGGLVAKSTHQTTVPCCYAPGWNCWRSHTIGKRQYTVFFLLGLKWASPLRQLFFDHQVKQVKPNLFGPIWSQFTLPGILYLNILSKGSLVTDQVFR